jgi:hypothetical protein
VSDPKRVQLYPLLLWTFALSAEYMGGAVVGVIGTNLLMNGELFGFLILCAILIWAAFLHNRFVRKPPSE